MSLESDTGVKLAFIADFVRIDNRIMRQRNKKINIYANTEKLEQTKHSLISFFSNVGFWNGAICQRGGDLSWTK